MDLITYLISVLWFFLPAGFANMAPVFFKRTNILDFPVDFNKTLRGKPLFGKNKTYRGFLFGILCSIIIAYLQKLLYPYMIGYSFINYSETNFIVLGFLLGFGALFGDLVKSFFKRRFNFRPGESWFPFDQLDWVIGSFFFSVFYLDLSWFVLLVALLFFCLLHPLINYAGYLLGIKKNKF